MLRYRQEKLENLDDRLASAEELIKVFNGDRASYTLKYDGEDLIFKGSPSISRLMPGLPMTKID